MPTRAGARVGESGPVWDVARVYYGLYDVRVTVDPASHCPRRDACPPCSVPRASIWTPPGSIKTALVDAPEGIAPLSPAIVSFCHSSVQRRFKVTCQIVYFIFGVKSGAFRCELNVFGRCRLRFTFETTNER